MAVGSSPAAYSYYGGPETGPQKTTEPLVNTNPIPFGGEAKIQVMDYSYCPIKKGGFLPSKCYHLVYLPSRSLG